MKFVMILTVFCLVFTAAMAVTGINDQNEYLLRGFNYPRNVLQGLKDWNVPTLNPITAFTDLAEKIPDYQAIFMKEASNSTQSQNGWDRFWSGFVSGVKSFGVAIGQSFSFLFSLLLAPMRFLTIMVIDVVVVVPAIFRIIFPVF